MSARTYLNCIAGELVPSLTGRTYPMHDPATGELVGYAQQSSPEDIGNACAAAKAAFQRTAWRHDSALRGRVFLEAARLLGQRKEDLARLYCRNNGKTLSEARSELAGCADIFVYCAGAARSLFGRAIDPAPNSFSAIVREPIGVVGIISPWNWPVLLMLREMVPALAAGNAVVVKPASLTAAVSMALVELLNGIPDLPKGILNAVTGPGTSVGDALTTNEQVGMIAFTGSGDTGRHIAHLCAENLKKAVLELGGKSPNIIFADADLQKAIPASVSAAFMTSGQLCMAGTRLLVQDAIYDQVLGLMKTSVEALKVGNGLDEENKLGPLISKNQMDIVLEYIKIGKEEGTCITGGHRLTGGQYDNGFFVAPTIFTDLSQNSRLVQEEIFGPVLVMQKFSTEEEAIAMANGTAFGLASAVWTRDITRAMRVARAMEAGTAWINCYFRLFNQAEYGGYKASGLGRTRGIDGILEFTEIKHINIDLA
jgi:betaine-aldehyde dehydrogenase